jgi:uncharacterized protein YjaG (DUF416 family)
MATSFSAGRSQRTTDHGSKQLVTFITCGCESSAPYFVYFIHKSNSSEADYINNNILKTGRHDIAEILLKVALIT